MNDKNKKIVTILSIFTIIFTLMGGTLAYWTWTSDTHTGVAFTISKEFSCRADGGQDLTSTNVQLQPTADCTNSEVALQRTIKVTPSISRNDLTISLNMWLTVNDIDPELAASDNLMYAISTVEGSCKKGMNGYVNSGNFKDLTEGDKANLVTGKSYTGTNLGADTYYLYIWLDAAETNPNTMDKSFDLSLEGECTDNPGPEAPALDDGMIPVTIADDGKLTIVSEDDPSWYNYDNKQWANVVLVEENATEEVENSHPRSYYQDTANIGEEVTQDDILAYYVWIPRYKYKIPTNKLCKDIENVTQETHPECYNFPYDLSISEEEFFERTVEYIKENGLLDECNYDEFDENGEPICIEETDMEVIKDQAKVSIAYMLAGGIDDWTFTNYNHIAIEEVLSEEEFSLTFYERAVTSSGPTTIDIEFETKESAMVLGNATTEYKSHPSFWWDDDSDGIVDNDEMLPGIWVGKFETTPDKNSECYVTQNSDNCNISTLNPTILPNEKSLKYQDLDNKFNTSQNFSKSGNIYGLDDKTINAHIIKNSDWGAVTYLSRSKYGINKNVVRSEGGKTGCGEQNQNGDCQDFYGTSTKYPQSTSGNISGIFDMSGGRPEFIMAQLGGEYMREEEMDNFGSLPASKYYDEYEEIYEKFGIYGYLLYQTNCTIETCGGHALSETSNWYKEYNSSTDTHWFVRGEYNILNFNRIEEYSDESITWRSVLVPGFGE